MPVTRKRKIEVARLAGFGLVLAGLFALFLAVVSSQQAGAVKAAPHTVVLQCHHYGDDSIGWAVQHGACETTTSTGNEGATTTTWDKHCGCSTTTTTIEVSPSSTSTPHHCGCSTTTTEVVTSTTEETTTSIPETTTSGGEGGVTSTIASTTTPEEASTSTSSGDTETSVTGEGITASTSGFAPVSNGGPVSGADAANSQQLPFTGSSSFPLAGLGLLLIASGLALGLRRRRLAR